MLPTISFMLNLAKNNFQDYKTFRMKCNFSKLSHQQQHLQKLTKEFKTKCTLERENPRGFGYVSLRKLILQNKKAAVCSLTVGG